MIRTRPKKFARTRLFVVVHSGNETFVFVMAVVSTGASVAGLVDGEAFQDEVVGVVAPGVVAQVGYGVAAIVGVPSSAQEGPSVRSPIR